MYAFTTVCQFATTTSILEQEALRAAPPTSRCRRSHDLLEAFFWPKDYDKGQSTAFYFWRMERENVVASQKPFLSMTIESNFNFNFKHLFFLRQTNQPFSILLLSLPTARRHHLHHHPLL